jgi:hypothetical protein
MKKRSIHAVLACAAIALCVTARASAHAPQISITSPADGSTIFVGAFPYTGSLTLSVVHSELKQLNQLNAAMDGNALFAQVGSPFTNANGCHDALVAVSTNCSTNGSDQATVVVPFTVTGPGTHAFSASVKHPPSETEAEEVEVTFAITLSVEYVAPPAVANSMINSDPARKKAASAKVRGCVISAIAERHAKENYYAMDQSKRGGPYDHALIENDLNYFWYQCGGV